MEKDQIQKNLVIKQKENELKEANLKNEAVNLKLNESERNSLLIQKELENLRTENASLKEDRNYTKKILEGKIQLISEYEEEKKELQIEFSNLNKKHNSCEKNAKVFLISFVYYSDVFLGTYRRINHEETRIEQSER